MPSQPPSQTHHRQTPTPSGSHLEGQTGESQIVPDQDCMLSKTDHSFEAIAGIVATAVCGRDAG